MSEPSVSRRFIPGLLVTVASGIAGFFVAKNSAAADPKPVTAAANAAGGAAGGGQRLAGADEVPPDGGLILKDAEVVLTRNATGDVVGFSAICTHQGCTVESVENGTINCPCHGSRFDAHTGVPVRGPASSPLPPIEVVVRDGAVFTAE
jgi:Rieske Fe-S protein